VAPAEHSGLPDGSVDCAVAAQAAHWFDLDAYYREVRRVARPGGLVALVTYAVLDVDKEISDVVARFYWKTLEGHWPAERKLVEEGYRSLPFPFEPVEAPSLALEHRWNAEQLLGYVGTWSAVQSLKKAGRGEDLTRFGEELRTAWGDTSEERLVRWPLSLRLGRVSPRRP
jgi:SAM-dependent methyltransferase